MLQFTALFPRDMKYFLSKPFVFDEKMVELIKVYEEFLVLNKGFTETKLNIDIQLPKALKTENAESFKAEIDKVLETQDLSKLIEYLPIIL